ncbi:hypothetical protein [Sinorhizobium meliloti]|uniref:hypothetical protein n=1 Tax=Rhizobium meliloti TaxID=382 RepID=UPI000FD6C1A4|nr:hypothetical protein [Sinorhizobium meliloti]RVG95998.1 hypothetical protein CN218_08110 [Sinorhizobium meliloti]WQP07810.1 hypothetical protein U8C39_19490 [Sinorhizobium meliloti]WQP21215.1 hypothetical protein U8C33_19620 [Sinorhizobium meliloti]WQP34630.1 hypothetical protein U8C45_19445 [Sinorhizobium meliloti]
MHELKSSTNAVRLDPRRVEHLKAIGQKLGLSNAGVVSHMIRQQIAAGVIDLFIPGITAKAVPGGVAIGLKPGQETTFTHEAARKLASTIRGVVDGTEAPTTVNMDHGFMVQKQGQGFRVAIPFGDTGVSFTPDLMLDLADLIEKAAE